MKLPIGFALLVLSVILAGCTVGPNYQAPQMSLPMQWGEPLAGGETNAPMGIVRWWTNFDEPVLDSLIELAVKSNYDLQMADARLLEARAQREASVADFWPTLEANASYTQQQNSKNAFLNGALNNNHSGASLPPISLENSLYQAGFDASWEMDLFGGKRRTLEAANADLAASYFDRNDVLVSLLAEVARNYIELRGLQERLAILRNNIKSQRDSVEVIRERFNGGLTSELEAEQAAALLAGLQSQVPTLETAIQLVVHKLAVLLGDKPDALAAELSRGAPIPPIPSQVPVGLPSDLLRRRPDVRRAERQLTSATALIGARIAQLFPRFSLTGEAGLESISAGDWFTAGSKFWSVGPMLQWNIFDAGRIRAGIRFQNAKQKEALANYEKTVLLALRDVEDALAAYAKEQARYHSLSDQVEADRRGLDIANELYEKGLTDFLNVLVSQRSLYQAQDELAQSQTALSEDLVGLYKSLGGGWTNFTETDFAATHNETTKAH